MTTLQPPPQRWYPSSRPLCADPRCRRAIWPPSVRRLPYAIVGCDCGVHSFVLVTQGLACVIGLTDQQADRFSDDAIRPADILDELGLLEPGQRKAG